MDMARKFLRLHEENSLLTSANPVKFRILSEIDPAKSRE